MGKYKICVYAISKNEEQFVDRWMDAVSEADMIVVSDTGSTDQTIEKLRARGAMVYIDKIHPWRFDAARNKALSHIPEDFEICVSNDLDEVFEKGWREKLENAWQPDTTRAQYLFTWSYNEDGSAATQFTMEKIHARHGFQWIRPVHEVLEYSGSIPDKSIWVSNLVINHYPDTEKPRSQYLPLLELSVQENPHDDRAAFWLGREYFYDGQYEKCIEVLQTHIKMPSASWDEEKCASMRYISQAYQARGDLVQAKLWLYKAIGECPHVREPYLQMARLGYQLKDWSLVYFMVVEGLKITIKTSSYLTEQDSWGYSFFDMGAISCYWLGLFEQSYKYAIEALNVAPEDLRLKQNLELIKLKYNPGDYHEQV